MEGRTGWARSGDANIAYHVMGEGDRDIAFVGGMISHVEVLLEEPGLRRWFERIATLGRLILVDRRGSGLSDPLVGTISLEQEAEDLLTVFDALDAERPVIQAYTVGGPLAVQFASMYPERVSALVLYACIARNLRDDDYDWASTREDREQRFRELIEGWGTGMNLDTMAPSVAGDERIRTWLGKLERLSTTPSGLQALAENFANVDVREILPTIRTPTLVVHRTDDQLIDVRHSRYMAAHIPGAKLVELPGVDSLPQVGDTEALLGEIEEFLTGGRRAGSTQRVMLTVLFTDIVDATTRAAHMGDGRWRDLLAAHEQSVRREIDRFDGHEVKTIGDSFLVTFDGAPSTALRAARAIVRESGDLGLEVRAGLHTGECEIIGDDVGGMAVHIAARVSALAGPGEVLASGTAFGTVVGSGLEWEFRGNHELKGVPGTWPLFLLTT